MERENTYPNSNFTTQRYHSNYFGTDYSEPNSNKKFSDLIYIQDYDKKISYLFKRFPYPDLVKIILKKLKFAYFQEKVFLDEIQATIKRDFEEHELKCLIRELNELTSTSNYLSYFEGHFYGNNSRVNYRMRNSKPLVSIEFRSFNPDYSDNEINWDDDLYETD